MYVRSGYKIIYVSEILMFVVTVYHGVLFSLPRAGQYIEEYTKSGEKIVPPKCKILHVMIWIKAISLDKIIVHHLNIEKKYSGLEGDS